MSDYLLATPHGFYFLLKIPPDLRQQLGKRELKKAFHTSNIPPSLLQTRDNAARTQKKLLANGVDPSEIKKAHKAADISKNENSFEVVARAWHAKNVERWAESHAKIPLPEPEVLTNIFSALGQLFAIMTKKDL